MFICCLIWLSNLVVLPNGLKIDSEGKEKLSIMQIFLEKKKIFG